MVDPRRQPGHLPLVDCVTVITALFLAAGAHAEQGRILLALAFVLVGAKLFGALVERVGQPAVLGELLFGVLLGNLALFGGPSLASLEASETFAILAELGAILLLFEVGLESTPRDMMAVGVPATVVALVGVVAPMALGYGVGRLMLPGESWMAHAFLGAMLAATSVGITARVLQEAKAIRTPSARIILGAAVIDDVLGLVVLAIIAGVIRAAGEGTTLAASGILRHRPEGARLPGRGDPGRLLRVPAALPPRPGPALDRRRAGAGAGLLLRPRLARGRRPGSPRSWAPSPPASSWRTSTSRTT